MNRGTRVRVHVDGEVVLDETVSDSAPARLRGSSPPPTFFSDPFRPEAETFFRLRELRWTGVARSEKAIRDDADRLELR
jgi:hypothetical protein